MISSLLAGAVRPSVTIVEVSSKSALQSTSELELTGLIQGIAPQYAGQLWCQS